MITVLLDSGAFSAAYSGTEITLEEYAKFLSEYKHLFQGGQITLDVIGDRVNSYKNWCWLRDAGYDVIPVFHAKGDDDDDGDAILKKYLDATDYIAIGAIAKFGTAARIYCLDRIWRKYLLDDIGKPTHRIHGLGMTSVRLITRYPWYSLDSASCTKSAMSGRIMIPRGVASSTTPDYTKIHMVVVSDQQRPGLFSGSLYQQPRLIQDRIREYCNRLGFDFDYDIEGRTLRPRRGIYKGETRAKKYSLPILEKERIDNGKNLTNYWEDREAFNYTVFDYLAKQINCKIYHACVDHRQIYRVNKLQLRCGVLVSYAYIRSKKSVLRAVTELATDANVGPATPSSAIASPC